MPKKRLTEEGVAKLNPPVSGKQVDYFDAVMPGLILRVNYGGAKVWRALHYVKRLDADGKRLTMPTTFKLGRYPTLSVKQARDKARQFLADPEKALAQADTGSFKEVAENFLKRHVEANKLRWQDEIERCLNKYIYPVWQHRTFRELKRADVAQLLDLIEDRHGKRQADVVLAIVRKIMRWFASRNDDYIVPVVPGMNRSNPKDRKRSRIIGKHKGKDGYNDDEFRAFWKACGETGKFGALLKVALLTAQRREKVASMQWADLVDGKWRIPSEEREKTNAGNLRLPQLVLDIINAQPRIDGNPHVFPGSTRGRRRLKGKPSGPPAFNSFSQAKAELDAKLPDLPHWTLHDLRRTARSLMSRAGVASDIAERVLGHAIAGVEGVYDQHDYAEEKADALQRLAALVETIINPPEDNVVALGERHRTRKQGGLARGERRARSA